MAAQGPPPVSKEQAFLETFFQCINNFAYDKAKDLAEREKSAFKSSPAPSLPWLHLVTCLGNLAAAEKAYSSLVFLAINLGQRILRRKDGLKMSFNTLSAELKLIEENCKANIALNSSKLGASNAKTLSNSQSHNTGNESISGLIGHLCGQLADYTVARTRTIEFFETMLSSSQFKNLNYEDLLSLINEIIEQHKKNFHHPILSPLKSAFTLECDVMSCLLQAQIELQHCQFMRSLLLLNDAHTKLASWSATLSSKEAKSGLFSSRGPPIPVLYQWLVKFKGVLLSKFTLYFYEVLAKQGPASELKSCTAKASVDFVSKIQQFQKKCDAFCVTIVYNTTQLPPQYQYIGPGYQLPSTRPESPLTGLESYPAIFTYPEDRAEKHWPSVISIMTDHVTELNTCEKVVCFQDPKIQSTYFMTRIERHLTFVVIFESKKSERDSAINNFIHDLCSHLRCARLFSSLKPK